MNDNKKKLYTLLGDNAIADHTFGKKVFVENKKNFVVEHYVLHLNTIEEVPALFIHPYSTKSKLPIVIYLHSHGGIFNVGKSEVLDGAPYLQPITFADSIIDMGYGIWALDAWGFEERGGIAESELFKEFLLEGKTLWGMRLFDQIALINYLETRKDVDTNRIASIGMSMGGMMSWWLAALDKRIKICVDISGQVNFESLIKYRLLDEHGFYLYIPKLLKEFTTLDIQREIIPRKRLSLVGLRDKLCFQIGADYLNEELKKSYSKLGVENNFKSYTLTGGHQETMYMRYIWKNFLKNNL